MAIKEKPKKSNNRTKRTILLGFLLAGIFLFLGISVIVIVIFGRVFSYDNVQSVQAFCTTEDEVYQTIVHDIADWLTVFPSSPPRTASSNRTITFDVPNRGKYIASSNFDSDPGELVVFVAVQPAWPNKPQGAKGYLYVPSEKQPAGDWERYYTSTYLGDNVYCYEEK